MMAYDLENIAILNVKVMWSMTRNDAIDVK